jgi:hypothetical protein
MQALQASFVLNIIFEIISIFLTFELEKPPSIVVTADEPKLKKKDPRFDDIYSFTGNHNLLKMTKKKECITYLLNILKQLLA